MDGSRIVVCMRDMWTYFGTSQILQSLTDVQVLYVIPFGIPVFDGDTEGFSVKNMLMTDILYHW